MIDTTTQKQLNSDTESSNNSIPCILCMEDKTPLASAKSDNHIPYQIQPLKLKEPHGSEDDYIKQEGPFTKETIEEEAEDCGRERLKRLRVEVAGRVWIPELWGQEDLLKDWIDCSAFHAPFVPTAIMTARAALVRQPRTPNNAAAGFLTIHTRC